MTEIGAALKRGLTCRHVRSHAGGVLVHQGARIVGGQGLYCPDCDWLIEAAGPAWRCER